jgi:chemotaxis protein histidine kinase CheA
MNSWQDPWQTPTSDNLQADAWQTLISQSSMIGLSDDDLKRNGAQESLVEEKYLPAVSDDCIATIMRELSATPAPVRPAGEERSGLPSNATVDLPADIREAFLEDAEHCLSGMEQAILALEAAPGSKTLVQRIGRELHTLKGASSSIGLVELAEFIHAVEEELNAPAGESPARLLEVVDYIRSAVASLEGTHGTTTCEASPESPSAVVNGAKISPRVQERSIETTDEDLIKVKSSQVLRLTDMIAELIMLRNRCGCDVERLQGIQLELQRIGLGLRVVQDQLRVGRCVSARLPEVEEPTSQIDELTDQLLQANRQLRLAVLPAVETQQALSQLIHLFRQELIDLRRLPVSGLMQRLRRAISDAARAEGKQITVQIQGEDAAIEKSIQEKLYEPLLHIVRNCVSHGIELAADRLTKGKQPAGCIRIAATADAERIELLVEDDGRGLDYDAVRRKGIEKGLINPQRTFTEAELSQLIFQPGFSTRSTADQVAGRGVGMDVVADAIARLHGWVQVNSKADQGTTFRLLIPVRSTIQHAMVFRVGKQRFAIPMLFVRGASKSHTAAEECDTVPGIWLAELLHLNWDPNCDKERSATTTLTIGMEDGISGGAVRHDREAHLFIDEVIGPEEIVISPLPPLLKAHPFFSGASMSGSGESILIFDGHRLLKSCCFNERALSIH